MPSKRELDAIPGQGRLALSLVAMRNLNLTLPSSRKAEKERPLPSSANGQWEEDVTRCDMITMHVTASTIDAHCALLFLLLAKNIKRWS
jgi:hypothetical protein